MRKNKVKKVSFLLANLDDGGVERVTINLATGLVDKGYNVEFVVMEKKGKFVSEVPKEITIIDLQTKTASKSLIPLTTYFRKHKPDVFISGKHYMNVMSILAKRFSNSKAKIFLLVHGMFSGSRFLPRLVRMTYPFANKVICVSKGVADNVASVGKVPQQKLKVIHNPVITPELISKASDTPCHEWLTSKAVPVVIAVGRLSPEKDFSTLIRAFSIVRATVPSKLIILGEGPERTKLEALISKFQLESEVSLPGYVSNPYSHMKAADVFVLSSISEGLPTVIIEAMYTGLPIVSTNCPSGPDEILEGGEYGLLVEVGNQEEMARSIIATLNFHSDKDLIKKRALEFSLDAAVENYINMIENY